MKRPAKAASVTRAELLLLLATTVGSTAAAEPAVDTDWIDFEKVRAGEVVWRTGKADRLTATADVALRIEAAPEAIWRILTACEVSPEYVPQIERCELVETVHDGRSEIFVQEVKPAFFLPSFEHVFRLDYEPYERIVISRVSGPLNHLQGAWTLLARDGGSTLLIHSLEVDPGMPIPRFLVRATLRRDLPDVLEAVRERAEALD